MKFAITKTGIGWVGIGIEGGAVCHTTVSSSKAAALETLVGLGATRPASAAEAGKLVDLVQRAAAGKDVQVNGLVKLIGGTGFQRSVWLGLLKIPRGSTISYAELARRVGRPGAARAVGQALGSNPVPILLPCHRVVAADGTLGGFGGGLTVKQRLLDLESGGHRALALG